MLPILQSVSGVSHLTLPPQLPCCWDTGDAGATAAFLCCHNMGMVDLTLLADLRNAVQPFVVETSSAQETQEVGARLASVLGAGDLLALNGELGAGKTTFVRGLVAGMDARTDVVRSPTFVLHHRYASGRVVVHHLDCYRLGDGADLSLLDLDWLLSTGIVVVEWGSYADLARFRPVQVEFDTIDDSRRRLVITPPRANTLSPGNRREGSR